MMPRIARVLITFMLLANIFGLSCCAQEKSTYPSNSTSENQTETQIYCVVFETMTPEYRDQVLSVSGVSYISDTIFVDHVGHDNEYPAIVLSANTEAAEKIKDFDFVYRISRTQIERYTDIGKNPTAIEMIKLIYTRLALPIFAIIFLLLSILFFVYIIKKTRNQIHQT
jgi:hypothetical protein